jgi:hypothetical protein
MTTRFCKDGVPLQVSVVFTEYEEQVAKVLVLVLEAVETVVVVVVVIELSIDDRLSAEDEDEEEDSVLDIIDVELTVLDVEISGQVLMVSLTSK